MAKKFHGTVRIGDDTDGWNFKRGSRVGGGHAIGHVLRVWREPSHGRELHLEFPFGYLGFFAWPDHGQLAEVLRKWSPLARESDGIPMCGENHSISSLLTRPPDNTPLQPTAEKRGD